MMLFALNEAFGKKLFNEWTQIFREEFTLGYWTRLWLFWAAGLNIFFGLINVLAAHWNFIPLKIFMVYADLAAYAVFLALAIWGKISGKCGSGVYAAWVIFTGWIAWGIVALKG